MALANGDARQYLGEAQGISLMMQGDALTLESKDEQTLPVVFNGISYAIKGRKILHNLCGRAASGKLLALLVNSMLLVYVEFYSPKGPTGAGKTTLLNLLAHRIKPDSGRISYGPYSWSKALKTRVGVVEQDDIVVTELTVRQSLRYVRYWKEFLTYHQLCRLAATASTYDKTREAAES